jgi:hypothetical protein
VREELPRRDGRGVWQKPLVAEVFRETTGILFTSGSGHVGARQFFDFTDCYAVGQELRNDAKGAQIVGGCSSNRHSKQLQCIYYAKLDRGNEVYDFTYDHAAITTFLPYSPSEYLLQHPCELASQDQLQLEFNEKDQYDEGRYFYIERINGLEPMDFLVDYWDVSLSLSRRSPLARRSWRRPARRRIGSSANTTTRR